MNYEKPNVKVGDKSSIEIAPHAWKEILSKIKKAIALVFFERTDYYLNMQVEGYREIMLQAEDIINKENMGFLLN